MTEGYRPYEGGDPTGYARYVPPGYPAPGYRPEYGDYGTLRDHGPEYGTYHGVPPYPPSSYPEPPEPRRPNRGLMTLLALAVAALLGAALGHYLWQPTGGGDTEPSILGPTPAEQPSSPAPTNVDDGVVDITTKLGQQGGGAAGTGMVLSPAGEVLTNNHVIEGATSITVTDVTTRRSYSANVVGYDRTDDVAVLQLQGASGLHTVSLGDSNSVGVGDPVLAVGNAGGVGGTPSHTSGQVTALNQAITASDDSGGNSQQLNGLLQVSANLQPGDSGGPLDDNSGRVIGMDTAGSQSRYATRSAGFAIPIDKAVTIGRQIEAGQVSPAVHIGATAFLGVEVATSGGQQSTVNGAPVVGVQPDAPAEQAGLLPGDVIVAVNQQPVTTPDALQAVLSGHHPGDRVTLQWVDQNGQQKSGTAELAAGPPS